MNKNVLLTGATGFLGTELADQLLKQTKGNIYALVRAEDKTHATFRLKAAWKDHIDLYKNIGTRIIPIPGDFERADLGMSKELAKQTALNIRIIIHAGADVGVMNSRETLMQTNRNGTGNLLRFASFIKKHHTFERFIQISTAYVAGREKGLISEEKNLSDSFCGYYEESKAAAETLVRKSGLPFSICRPGMIIGSSKDGHIRNG